jgi:hypothetical protein
MRGLIDMMNCMIRLMTLISIGAALDSTFALHRDVSTRTYAVATKQGKRLEHFHTFASKVISVADRLQEFEIHDFPGEPWPMRLTWLVVAAIIGWMIFSCCPYLYARLKFFLRTTPVGNWLTLIKTNTKASWRELHGHWVDITQRAHLRVNTRSVGPWELLFGPSLLQLEPGELSQQEGTGSGEVKCATLKTHVGTWSLRLWSENPNRLQMHLQFDKRDNEDKERVVTLTLKRAE